MPGAILNRVKKLPKKYLIIGLIVIVVVAYFFLRPKPQPKFEFASVKRQDIASTISASGVLAGKNTINLNFLQGGRLAFVNVKTGDRVSEGQVVAGLDTQALGIELQQASNTLRDKQATVDKVLDDIHLFQYGNGGFANVGTPNETETQRQLRTTAEVARDNAFDSIRAVQRNFQDTVVTAPFSGIITQTNVFPGQFVGPSNLVAQLVDDSEVFFDTDVDQADVNKVSPGQQAEVSLDAYPNKIFKGIVNEILPLTRVTSTQATVVTARVVLEPVQRFVVGLQGQASITADRAKNALTIPIEALRPDNSVVIQTPNGLKIVKVRTGIQSDTDIEIKEGLKEGQEVITNPPAK